MHLRIKIFDNLNGYIHEYIKYLNGYLRYFFIICIWIIGMPLVKKMSPLKNKK